MHQEAVAEMEKAADLTGSLNAQASLAHAYARAGRKSEARAILGELTERTKHNYVPSYYFALIHAGLGEPEESLEWVHRAYQERSTILAYLQVDPRLDPLRSLPGFQELARRLGMS